MKTFFSLAFNLTFKPYFKFLNLSKLIIFLNIFLLNSVFNIKANNSNDFFPLNIGNYWVYHFSAYGYGGYHVEFDYAERISDTVRINSRLYYKFVRNGDTSVTYYRVDSLSGILYRYQYSGCYDPKHEIAIDSLNSSKGNSFGAQCISIIINCTDTSLQNLFGNSYRSKKFEQNNYITLSTRVYLYGIGSYVNSYSVNAGGHSYGQNSTLKGCIINGVTYGDLSITGNNNNNINTPLEFSLSQNYPNPFNPQNKIKFAVPNVSITKLIVYDLLGREVTTLVNEELKPGTYEADWDGSAYSSGVYFYKLEAGDFTVTKKMLMVK